MAKKAKKIAWKGNTTSNSGVPELERESGSWIVTSPQGQVAELFERENAEKAAQAGWLVETSLQYLTRLNRGVKEGKSLKARAKPAPACGPGEDLIHRKGYTRSDGTRVAATTFCQEDRGRPGVRSFGAKSASGKYADRADMPPLITREGKLGGKGYTERPAKTRRAILKRCVEGGKMKLDGEEFDSPKYGYRSCLGSLTVLLTSTEISAKKRKVIESDVKWLEKNYGGKKENPGTSKLKWVRGDDGVYRAEAPHGVYELEPFKSDWIAVFRTGSTEILIDEDGKPYPGIAAGSDRRNKLNIVKKWAQKHADHQERKGNPESSFTDKRARSLKARLLK